MATLEHHHAAEPRMTREDQERWTHKGREALETLQLPAALKALARASLDTPQLGPYHNEGPRMDAHLGAIMEAAEQIADGTFEYAQVGLDATAATALRAMLERVCQTHTRELTVYAYLHDLKKPECMNVEYADGTQRVFTVAEWEQAVSDADGDEARARTALQAQGIVKIGYRQDAALTGGQERDHGPEGEEAIRALAKQDSEVAVFAAQHELILTGVGSHEMHFQKFPKSSNAGAYRDNLATVFPPETIDFILAVNFLDIAGSRDEHGASDFTSFRNMLQARVSYDAIAAFMEEVPTLARFAGKPDFLENALNALFNLGTPDAVRAKIAEHRKPPEATHLTDTQIATVEAKLPEWAGDLKLSDEQQTQAREALRDAHYARALNAVGLGKLTGLIKRMLTAKT
ncbi:MAG: hypothetical protein Q7T01_03460 [bacterium]|nr:hypothetical protein [bacterium]